MTDLRPPPDLTSRVSRAQLAFSVTAVVVGALGFWVSRNQPFSGGAGAVIFDDLELRTMSYNGLGAALTLVLGVVGVVGSVLRRPVVGLVAGAGFGVIALQPLLQWRSGTENVLASNGRNFGFALALALGLVVPAIVARLAVDGGSGDGSDRAGSPTDVADSTGRPA